MQDKVYGKILGCLGMVAIGDAMGMPCHDMTTDEIRQRFNEVTRVNGLRLEDVARGLERIALKQGH
jgi:ADP-ribosylglycohydrolase